MPPTARKIAAVQAEAQAAPTVVVEWRDQKFTIETETQDWSLDVVEAFEDGKIVSAVRGILGPVQWAQIKATSPKMRDLESLYEAVAEALGLGSAGE